MSGSSLREELPDPAEGAKPSPDGPDLPDHADRADHPVRPDHEVFLDSEDDDWAWRRRIRSTPTAARVYRVGVFVLGLVVVVVGILLIPFPGPGWLIVIGGLAIWSTEFERAQRVLEFVKRHGRAWEAWIKRQNPVLRTRAAQQPRADKTARKRQGDLGVSQGEGQDNLAHSKISISMGS